MAVSAKQLVLVAVACGGAEIRGKVVDSTGTPLSVAKATITGSGEATTFSKPGEIETGGGYRFRDLAPGEYQITLIASGSIQAVIRRVAVRAGGALELPTLQLALGFFCGAPHESHPAYYRLVKGLPGTGALSGTILSEHQQGIAGATLVLYRRESGRLAVTRTDGDGNFSFRNLPPRSDYRISVSSDGYFTDTLEDMTVQADWDSVYSGVLESCGAGPCEKSVKSFPILAPCG